MRYFLIGLGIPGILLGLALPGCVELDGQRISIYHDAAQDRLLLLLFYDGIHDSGSDSNGNGVEQIQEAVDHGDFMLLDWYGYVCLKEIPNEYVDVWRAVLERSTTFPIGTYRDFDGRIGAAQGVEVAGISSLVETINQALRRHAGESEEAPRMELEGHSVRIRYRPDAHADAEEMARVSALVEELAGLPKPASLGFVMDEDWVTWTIGRRDAPGTVRIGLRQTYEPNLETVLEQSLPLRMDDGLASFLLGPEDGIPELQAAWLDRLVSWGPPEEQVRVALGVAAGKGAERREAALAWLEGWEPRNHDSPGLPAIPRSGSDPGDSLTAWEGWCRDVVHIAWPWVD